MPKYELVSRYNLEDCPMPKDVSSSVNDGPILKNKLLVTYSSVLDLTSLFCLQPLSQSFKVNEN